MEIISKTVELKLEKPYDNSIIEAQLAQMGIKPLRWAITKIGKNSLTISLASENL